MSLDVTELLAQLVRIPSINPMGKPVEGPEYLEYAVTEFLQRLFTERGWQWERQTVAPQRDNILAVIPGDPAPADGGTILMWEAHQDTVPVVGMTIPPFDPQIRDGRLYGRGACDIKGGLASLIAAAARVEELPRAGRPTIVLACTVNEEHGYSGAKAVTELWESGQSKVLPRRPDAIIVSEPTELDVVTAHKGVSRWRCHTHGRAAHSSNPANGENAIYAMARVLEHFESYARDVAPTLQTHRLVGTPTLSIGTIIGGLSVNTVPDHCTIEVDRRVLPGEDPLAAQQAIIDYIAERLPAHVRVEHEPPFIASTGLSDDNNGPFAERLAAVIRRCGHGGAIHGVPYGTNGSAYSPSGAPTVVFGPGSIAQAHTADEWVEISQLHAAVDILVELARSYAA